MNNQQNNVSEKFYTINDFSNGDWVCFLLPNNKKCIGIINELILRKGNDDLFFDVKKIISYIDEDGLNGSIQTNLLSKTQRVIGIDFNNFFNNKFSLKNEIYNKIDTKNIAKTFMKKSKQKRMGKIINN